jgi:hypothetical protein
MIKFLNQSVGRLRLTKIKIAISGVAASAAVMSMLVLAAAPARADRQSFNNWHVHDGGNGYTDASGLTHRVSAVPEDLHWGRCRRVQEQPGAMGLLPKRDGQDASPR